MDSGYSINIAKAHETRKKFQTDEPQTFHYVRLQLGEVGKKKAYEILADTCSRYPAPEFKVTMTYWEQRGYECTPLMDEVSTG